MKFYPKQVNKYFSNPKNVGVVENANAVGKWASFLCGVSVQFSLFIDEDSKRIIDAKFKTNGCGFVIAIADFVCENIIDDELTKLHGLEELEKQFEIEFGELPEDRMKCADICFEAIQDALANYRNSIIEEWAGEKALICTCFGVSEERIENQISLNNLQTVEEVGDTCNAGTGCGSCQPLIQEILDTNGW